MAFEAWAPFSAMTRRCLGCCLVHAADPSSPHTHQRAWCDDCEEFDSNPGAHWTSGPCFLPSQRAQWDGLACVRAARCHMRSNEKV